MTAPNVWAKLAQPLLRRLDDRWQDERRATAGLSLPDECLFSAVKGGFAVRRRHWLTRRWQLRLNVPAYQRQRMDLPCAPVVNGIGDGRR